jgi:hypothetical protein
MRKFLIVVLRLKSRASLYAGQALSTELYVLNPEDKEVIDDNIHFPQ